MEVTNRSEETVVIFIIESHSAALYLPESLQNINSITVKSYVELNRNSSTQLSTQNAKSSLPSMRPYNSVDLNWSPRALSQRRATGALELYDSEMDNCESGLSRISPKSGVYDTH
ncbi:hypothetical protein CDAR_56361 [Caerostris darwini]|uniref:Uncharacterized protein n=1 Tax=Caerostris darwini TaxID=1538125 RepID=A0AAV4WLB1_9ARAC|nr:hypothetical protein CDAR_56361 [Caerostris darwini]